MPDTHDSDTHDSGTHGSARSESADHSNRAARRRRGKDTSSSQAFGKVQDTGRRNSGQGPRHWSARRGG
jgi:hypothetical protein